MALRICSVLAATALVGTLAACGGAGGSQGGHRTTDPSACGADRFAAMQGAPVTKLPGDEVDGPIRLIRPGDAVTQDFNPARLNVSLDKGDIITSLTCG